MADLAPTMRPYGRHLLICTGGDCAASEQGQALIAAAPELFGERRRLRNPERIKCSAADCLGVCAAGPIAVVYPDGIWYHHLDLPLLAEIVREHLVGGRPVERAIFHRLYPPGQEPPYAPALRGEQAGAAPGGEDAAEGQESELVLLAGAPGPSESAGLAEQAAQGGAPAGPPAEAIAPSDTTIESSEQKRARRAEVRKRNFKKGLVIVNTGSGKGKTTAALGTMLRAWGRGLRIRVIQFLKHENARFGEVRAAERMGVEFGGTGDGFTWTSQDIDASMARALHGWELARQAITSGQHDLLILDEFTYVMAFGWLPACEVVDWLRQHKPPALHLIITGRDAPPELVAYADLVTEMREIKHPYKEQGVRAQPGIEF